MIFYTQCKLRRGTSWTVSIIPDRYAVKGKFLKLKDADGNWEDGWEVIDTYTKFPEDVALHNEMLWRHHREATDI